MLGPDVDGFETEGEAEVVELDVVLLAQGEHYSPPHAASCCGAEALNDVQMSIGERLKEERERLGLRTLPAVRIHAMVNAIMAWQRAGAAVTEASIPDQLRMVK